MIRRTVRVSTAMKSSKHVNSCFFYVELVASALEYSATVYVPAGSQADVMMGGGYLTDDNDKTTSPPIR